LKNGLSADSVNNRESDKDKKHCMMPYWRVVINFSKKIIGVNYQSLKNVFLC